MPLDWCDKAPCFLLGIWEERGRTRHKHQKLSLFGEDDFFSPPPLPTLSMCNCVSVCDSQTVHRCAVEGITRHLLDAIAGEPSVGRKRSQSRKHQAVTATVKPFSFDSKEAFFFFSFLCPAGTALWTFHNAALWLERKPTSCEATDTGEAVCVFAGAQFHRREVGCYLWKHTCVENNQINKIQFDTVAEIIGIFPAQLLHHLHVFSSLFSDQVGSPYLFFVLGCVIFTQRKHRKWMQLCL